MYSLDTLDLHPGKLELRLLVRTGKLNSNIKLYTAAVGLWELARGHFVNCSRIILREMKY